jgi:hypothetical protein
MRIHPTTSPRKDTHSWLTLPFAPLRYQGPHLGTSIGRIDSEQTVDVRQKKEVYSLNTPDKIYRT